MTDSHIFKKLLFVTLLLGFLEISSAQVLPAVFVVPPPPTCDNGTAVENTTQCDPFATRTYMNSTHDCCECEADFTGNGTSCGLATKLECSQSSLNNGYAFRVSLNQSYIDYYNISTSTLRLMNASCNNVTLQSGYYVLWSPLYDDCGSIKTNTSTSIVYTNAVTNDGGTITSGTVMRIEIECTVSALLAISLSNSNGSLLSLSVASVTSDSIVFPIQEGNGQVTAAMYLFKDSNYNQAYNGVPVLNTADMLYVMIALDGNALSNIFMITRECWATPDAAGVSSERFDIIEEPGCLKTGVTGGSITSNGVSNNVKFQLPVFSFLPSNVVYLHCAVQLCTGSDCAPSCSSRKKRDANTGGVQILRSSLIIRSDEKIREPPNIQDEPSNNEDLLTSNTFTIIIVLLAITGFMLIAIVALLIYVCVTRQRKHT